jgi:hypothetical protein
MENALRACCKGIKVGKILIHREGDNGQQVCEGSSLCFQACLELISVCVIQSLSSDYS